MPLAHILLPQLARKTDEIQRDLALNAGYLQASSGGTADAIQHGINTVVGPVADRVGPVMEGALRSDVGRPIAREALREAQNVLPPPPAQGSSKLKTFDPRSPGGAYLQAAGKFQNAADPVQRAVGRGMTAHLKVPRPEPQLLPAAGRPAAPPSAAARPGYLQFSPGEQIGTDELGRAVYAPDAAPAAKGKPVMKLAPGEKVLDDAGRAVDPKTRKAGYLRQSGGARTAERRPSDVGLDQRDAFAIDTLRGMFGEHLKAMQDNRDADGMPTDKFPDGYFKGMSKIERENIIRGVRALQEIERGTRA